MKTESLIRELAHEGKMVHELESPVARFIRWGLISLLCIFVGVAVMGVRTDLEAALTGANFLIQAILLLGLAILSGLSAFVLSIPGQIKQWFKFIPVVTLSLWLSLIVGNLIFSPNSFAGMGLTCAWDILVLGFAPGAVLFLMLRKAAPLKVDMVGLLAATSVVALGALGTQFICRNDDPLHVLVWHFLPVVILGSMGILLGRLLLKWDTR